jgi:hypothetical protein
VSGDRGPVTVRLDEVERIRVGEFTWLPLRRALGATAFGVGAFEGAEPGDIVVEPHDETSGGAAGHEEVYIVVSGRARFTGGGEELDAPAGTLTLVPPGVHRVALAEQPGCWRSAARRAQRCRCRCTSTGSPPSPPTTPATTSAPSRSPRPGWPTGPTMARCTTSSPVAARSPATATTPWSS